MVNFPARIPGCDSHSPALLDLFLCSDANICSVMDVHGRIPLSSVLLLLLVSFLSGLGLELMYISLTENTRSSLIHLHGFQLLVLLAQFIEITFFVCTKRINLPILK